MTPAICAQRRAQTLRECFANRFVMDLRAQELWDEYTKYKERMFEVTDTALSPWVVIDANSKRSARVEVVEHLLRTIPYV